MEDEPPRQELSAYLADLTEDEASPVMAQASEAEAPEPHAPPARILGRSVVAARPASGGYTRAWRGRVTLDDGRHVFVKSAAGDAAAALRHEAHVLKWLADQGRSDLGARLLDFTDGDTATLVIEDLSKAIWPPPYPADTSRLFAALDELATVDAPADLDTLESWGAGEGSMWARVAADPAAFLRLGVCSPAWLERNLGALIESERLVDLRGDSLVHNDVYSGNVCFVGDRAVLTDWATAARGNPDLDVAFAIVSVLAEEGRLPARQLLADEGAWAARLAGHNAVEASSPLPDWAEPNSTLRQDQLGDLRVALAWTARALELPTPVLE